MTFQPAALTPSDTDGVCPDEGDAGGGGSMPHDCGQGLARSIIWNFESLRMLIGTDLPIFGGDEYPCVSLKLADMAKPINVLTG